MVLERPVGPHRTDPVPTDRHGSCLARGSRPGGEDSTRFECLSGRSLQVLLGSRGPVFSHLVVSHSSFGRLVPFLDSFTTCSGKYVVVFSTDRNDRSAGAWKGKNTTVHL